MISHQTDDSIDRAVGSRDSEANAALAEVRSQERLTADQSAHLVERCVPIRCARWSLHRRPRGRALAHLPGTTVAPVVALRSRSSARNAFSARGERTRVLTSTRMAEIAPLEQRGGAVDTLPAGRPRQVTRVANRYPSSTSSGGGMAGVFRRPRPQSARRSDQAPKAGPRGRRLRREVARRAGPPPQ